MNTSFLPQFNRLKAIHQFLAERLLTLSLALSLLAICLASILSIVNAHAKLPVYNHQEKELGEYWLRSFRAQVRTSNDPITHEYLRSVISKLTRRNSNHFGELQLVVVDNPNINAFAVPGGVMGINLGVFLVAEREGELASIISHELAHLSERHYARTQQKLKDQRFSFYAGLLLATVLAANGSAEGAQAAALSSQAAYAQKQLRFSREFEQEADRIGVENLSQAGYPATDMIAMFEKLKARYSYSDATLNPPEYLLTHPLPLSRMNALRSQRINQVTTQKQASLEDKLHYQLVKIRIQEHYQSKNKTPRNIFASRIPKTNTPLSTAKEQINAFAAAQRYHNQAQNQQAEAIYQRLIASNPREVIYHVELLDNYFKQGKYQTALSHLRKISNLHEHPAIAEIQVRVLNAVKQHKQAQQILFKQIQRDPKNTSLWYALAETSGLLQDIVQVHQARAEYFILKNQYAQAKQQLNYLLELHTSKLTRSQLASVEYKLKTIDDDQDRLKKLGF